MRKLYTIAASFVLLALLIYVQNETAEGSLKNTEKHGLPWQIKQIDNQTEVFGLTIGSSQLSDAIAVFGEGYELAILAKHEHAGALELFYNHVKSGPLVGKLAIVADSHPKDIYHMRKHAIGQEYLETGTKKYKLSTKQQQIASKLLIRSITYIPSARLNQELIELRFGNPALVLKTGKRVTHYLYPHIGLDILIDQGGKDLLQYVTPSTFGEIQSDLHKLAEKFHASTKIK